MADQRVSFRASSAVPTPRGDRVSSRTFMMVAPSFEMVVTPLSSCTSLSKPRGPCAIGRAWSAEIRNQKGGAGDDVRICEPRGDAGTYQGGADGVHHRHARVDVGNQLAFALAGVRALAQEHDLGLLEGEGASASEGTDRGDGNKKDLAARAPARVRTRGVTAWFRDETRGAAGGATARTIICPLGICMSPAMVLDCDRACDQ